MHDTPLRAIIVADPRIPKVQVAWERLEPIVRSRKDLIVTGVDEGGLDYTTTKSELVIVIGGDGAILRACRHMGQWQLPILGVNLGRLGFLADLSPTEFCDLLPQIAERQYHILQYLMFECALIRKNGERQVMLGLNEVEVLSGAAMKMIDVQLSIDDVPVTTYSGDGVIISTPVGSTAHNLSAGGPIVRQDLQAFVITPICPHALTMRALVDSADCVYTLEVPDIPDGVHLMVDGQIRLPLNSGDRVDVRRAAVRMQIAKVPGSNYYLNLHRKLNWGGQPNYQSRGGILPPPYDPNKPTT